MTLNIKLDKENKVWHIGGKARVSDIRKYGLIEASRRNKELNKGYTFVKKVKR